MAEKIPLIVFHTGLGAAAGVTFGVVTDSVFPEPGPALAAGDNMSAAKMGGEIIAQLAVNGLLTSSFLAFSQTCGEDPTQCLAYMYTLMQSQPALFDKIARLSAFLKSAVGTSLGVTSAEVYTPQSNKLVLPKSQQQVRSVYMQ